MDTLTWQSFEIYLLVSTCGRYHYIGSAWGKPSSNRVAAHLAGKGGAKALKDAIDSGVTFRHYLIRAGYGTRVEALTAEEDEISRRFDDWGRKTLNLNLHPATRRWGDYDRKSDDIRQSLSVGQRERWDGVSGEETRRQYSERLKKLWSDPAFKQKRSEAIKAGLERRKGAK